MNKTALFRAVSLAGGQQALSKKIGVSQGHLWCWLHRDKVIPAERCAAIEKATGVSRYELRPDIFGEAPVEVPTSKKRSRLKKTKEHIVEA